MISQSWELSKDQKDEVDKALKEADISLRDFKYYPTSTICNKYAENEGVKEEKEDLFLMLID